MKLEKPSLIICDVDGTLIDRSEDVTPEFDVLSDLIAENRLCFSLASGRCSDQLEKYVEKLRIDSPLIINNGAGARENGKPLWDIFMDPMALKPTVKRADEMDMAIFLCFGDHELVYRHNSYIQHEIDAFGRYNHFYIPLESEWPGLKLEKVMITDPQKPGRVDELLPRLAPLAGELNVIRYDARHLDIMAAGVTKGAAIRRLAELLGVPLQSVMAIGDSENDMEMLQEVGIGAAVGNAKDCLKACADYVCSESNTAGVIEAIRRFCTEKGE